MPVIRNLISFRFVMPGARFVVEKIKSMTDGVRGRLILFGTVGLSGFVPNLCGLFLLAEFLGMSYAIAAIVATQFAICWNFLLLDQVVYRQCRTGSWYRRAEQFLTINNLDLLLRIPMLAALVEFARIGYMVASVVTLVAMFALRFIVTDRLIYRIPRLRVTPSSSKRRYLRQVTIPTTTGPAIPVDPAVARNLAEA
jgi:dolichol-phosphate mannosyltransferase